ncbi:TPA: superoxide dismutase [archaeon]|nr:superoxide dismutase [Candidatus Undinarchaeales archaeon SRR5007147.bin71]
MASHELPKLNYAYDALEPFIDAQTMEIHHSKHHQAYVNNLNKALDGQDELAKLSPSELLKDLSAIPDDIRQNVINHGGGHANHTFFWTLLEKDVEIPEPFMEVLKNDFGSFDSFKGEFTKAASSVFGSGWAWLVLDSGKLSITESSNQDTPLSQGLKPVLTIDVWEHAYYLKYQNRRADYIDAFFNVINWEQVHNNFKSD